MKTPDRKDEVAYFSMEFAVGPLPHSGGLGVLAGDLIKSCADLGLPVVGVGINYRQKMHQKLLEDGWQTELYEELDLSNITERVKTDVRIPIKGEEVLLDTRKYDVVGENSTVPIFLLTTNGNDICGILYPSNYTDQRLAQAAVLGIGGSRTLDRMGYNVQIKHLNEGDGALAGLENGDKKIVFTSHTPVEAGHCTFSKGLVQYVLSNDAWEKIRELGGVESNSWGEQLNMTRLAMASASKLSGVAPTHTKVSKNKFSSYPNIDKLEYRDNGVHPQTWTSPELRKLYDDLTHRGWRIDPKTMERATELSDEQVLNAHEIARERLGRLLKRGGPRIKGYAEYNPEKLTVVFPRRCAVYKDPTLILRDTNRLRKLGKDTQIIYAGKAHPNDWPAKELIKEIFCHMKDLKDEVSIWFVEDYNIFIARVLLSGVDLLLNTPRRLQEASGTSGMKAGINGVPSLSIIDGWYVPQQPAEGYRYPRGLIEGVSGWAIGPDLTEKYLNLLLKSPESEDRNRDAQALYDKLEYEIIPLFKKHKTSYSGDRNSWAKVMKSTIASIGPWYNTHRLARQHFETYGIDIRPYLEEAHCIAV